MKNTHTLQFHIMYTSRSVKILKKQKNYATLAGEITLLAGRNPDCHAPPPTDSPECLPFLLASRARLTRDREWMVWGLRMIKPSFTSLRMFCRELALAISVVSFGSSQILRLPHFSTEAASRFWRRRVLQGVWRHRQYVVTLFLRALC